MGPRASVRFESGQHAKEALNDVKIATIEKISPREKQRLRLYAKQGYEQTLKYPKYWNSAGTKGNDMLL